MTSQPSSHDLVSLERSLFRETFSHGLIDIAIACFVVLFAVGPFTTSAGLGDFWGTAVFIPFWAFAALVLWLVHRRCVLPRMGYVQFGQPRRRRLLTWNIVAFVICAVALVVGVISGSQFGLLPPFFHTIAFSIFVFAGLSLAGYFMDLRRLYLYAVVIASAPLTGELLWKYAGVPHHGYPVTFGLAALLCFFVGVGLLGRFIARHHAPAANSVGE